MATYGNICEFDEQSTKWSTYKQRLEFYFEANNIEDAKKKRATFVSVVGDKTYEILLGLVAPNEPPKVDYAELIKALDGYYSPKPNIIIERFKFYDCAKSENETMTQYLTKLKSLSRTCRFGADESNNALTPQQVLEENLRDKFVWEMKKNTRVQQRLLSEKELTYAKTVEIAGAMELAQQGVECVAGSAALPKKEVYKVSNEQSRVAKEKHSHKQSTPARTKPQPNKKCFRCASTEHTADVCKYKTHTCKYCKKVGHVQSNCFSLKKNKREYTKKQHVVNMSPTPDDVVHHELFNVQNQSKAYMVDIMVDGKRAHMQVDTGAAVTMMSKQSFNKHYMHGKRKPRIKPSSEMLVTYTGQRIPLCGTADVTVTAENKSVILPLIIVQRDGPTLLGRNWLEKIKINWSQINNVAATQKYTTLLKKYGNVFESNTLPVKGVQAKIHVNSDAKPQYYKARPIPYALREKLDIEIDRLLAERIIVPVSVSEWAAPVVPVVKSNGSIRLCGDYKVTVNKVTANDSYPIPKIADLYAKLGGGKLFTRLDMRHAYEQLELHPDSRKYVTINTHRGLFTHTRLPYGVSSAPSIFQRVMDSMFQKIPNVLVYLDDILISGTTEAEHLATLEMVLAKLSETGFHLKKEKCEFLKTEVVFLGHKVDAHGLHPVGSTLNGIVRARTPTCLTELRSFIGMVNHYSRFIKGLSSKLNPLHKLLRADVKWYWGAKQEAAFANIKRILSSPPVVVHFDPAKPLMITSDASEYGIGIVLSHTTADGSDQPIACYSRTLSKAERNYSQLDKEGLAVIWGLKKCHQFVYGRHVTIVTDHKPLLTLFGENKQIPQIISPRIQRWALMLATYDYTIRYKPGRDIPVADALSRLPDVTPRDDNIPIPGDTVMFMEHLDTTPVTAQKIANWTKRDRVLSRVLDMTRRGIFNDISTCDEELKPYIRRKDELSVQDDILLWGMRVVIPPPGRKTLLDELHATHPGIVRMKALARSIIYWPKLDIDIEHYVRTCNECQRSRHAPAKAPLHPWIFTDRPWSRLHIDYAGPVSGKMLLVIIDSHSKWIDVHTSTTSTSTVTIEHLRKTFSTHGLPDTLVTDNATCFTSEEFEHFCTMNGIKHITPAPYHPASNGLAERAVQTVKEGIERLKEGTLETKLSRFLFSYRITPQATTNTAPSELLMKRKLKSTLDLVRPDLRGSVQNKQQTQKNHHDQHAKHREFDIGDNVFALIHTRNNMTWLPATITAITGPLSYVVMLDDNRTQRCHIDQLRKRESIATTPEQPSITVVPPSITPPVPKANETTNDNSMNSEPTTPPTPVATPQPVQPRRSSRSNAGIPPPRLGIST